MTKQEWIYANVDKITRADMEELRLELEEKSKTKELDWSEKELLRLAQSKEKIAVVQMMIMGGL